MSTSQATFGAGCFWGVEAEFRRVEGVVSTEVGYAGGAADRTTYVRAEEFHQQYLAKRGQIACASTIRR